MRSERTSGISPSTPILPASAADWIGDSGGTYQTIGRVRYSGCSGKATFQSIAIFQRSEEHTSELQSLMRSSSAVSGLEKNTSQKHTHSRSSTPHQPTYST